MNPMERYRSGDSLFLSPSGFLLGKGAGEILEVSEEDGLAPKALEFLRGATRKGLPGVLIGAVPFESGKVSRLRVPLSLEKGLFQLPHQDRPLCLSCPALLSCPTPQTYEQNVSEALGRIRSGAFKKVVLSRSLRIDTRVDIPRLIGCLAGRNPLGYTYAVDLEGHGGSSRCLVGASPELLLSRSGSTLRSQPLAGSIAHSRNPQEDRDRAKALLQSPKDLYEHALVVDAVASVLGRYCKNLKVPKKPSLVSTATMWHLGSAIGGELVNPRINSLEVALALHPTPAVCGHPTSGAREFIDQREGFDRGFFTGLVGWCDVHGDGEWAVTIRCAEITDTSATLYAGAGIVEGSDPVLELEETSAKLGTMLEAMGFQVWPEDAA